MQLSWQRLIMLEKPSLPVVVDRAGSAGGAETPSRHASLSVNEHDDFEWIPYADAKVRPNSRTTTMDYVTFPVWQGTDPAEVQGSHEPDPGKTDTARLSFILEGKAYAYSVPTATGTLQPVVDHGH